MMTTIQKWTGMQTRDQGPAFLVGLGHSATHWIIGTFYVLLPFIKEDLGLSYAETGGLHFFTLRHLLQMLEVGLLLMLRDGVFYCNF
jgi:hypothetical protein